MTLFLTLIHVVVCFVLIIVILVQGGRGQGLTGPSFTSGNVQSLFGTQAADFLTKATTVSAILFLLTCLSLNFIEARKSKSLMALNRDAAPVDIDAVKKALDKVTQENAAKTSSAVATAEKEAAAEVNKIVDTAKAEMEKAADKLKEESTVAAQAPAQPNPGPAAS